VEAALQLFVQYGLIAVFAAVFLEQVGAPIPALPVLLLAGALAANDPIFGALALIAAVVASTIGDLLWFWAGRRYGHRVLKLMCKVSISPDSCVRQTEATFERRGVGTLVIAKFVPGLSTIAPPLAGALGLKLQSFLIFNGAGSALWAGAGLLAGLLFHDQIDRVLEAVVAMGGYALVALGVLLGLYIAYRWYERRRFYKALQMARISADELYRLMNEGDYPVILDVRSRAHREVDPRVIPGARPVDLENLDQTVVGLPPGREVIVYCACPNEASAVNVARLLAARGFKRVRPLSGGLDAWAAAGFGFEGLPDKAAGLDPAA
jgi:membrane protein DedA with SNARE-associated domain/rhodanese-related sulfurtransferase